MLVFRQCFILLGLYDCMCVYSWCLELLVLVLCECLRVLYTCFGRGVGYLCVMKSAACSR